MLRRVGFVFALVLCSPLTAPTEASAALTSPTSVLDWNAAGQSIGNGVDLWLWQKIPVELNNRNPQPTILTFQGVCEDQVYELWNRDLRFRGFTQAAFYTARTGVDSICGGEDFGNAVFMVGGGTAVMIRFNALNQPSGIAEKRGIACMASAQQSILSVCSLHLINSTSSVNNLPWADCQAAEAWTSYFDIWRNSGELIIAAGDFNIAIGTAEDGPPVSGYNYCHRYRPGYTALEHAYYWCYESDQYSGSTTSPTQGSRKLDAIFIYKSLGYFWADLYRTYSDSDHMMLTGYVDW